MSNIYDKYFYKIYSWALKKTRNKEDAEDITSSTFVAIYEYLSKDVNIEKIDNLIWKIAYNIWTKKAKEYIENKNNESIYEKYDIGINDVSIDKIIYKEILDNLDNYNLTDKELNSFKLYYINDLSIKEIAIKLNSSESNIKYYLYSARKKIKERYDD
ncbi:MAG: RNA polymerase sigma factor [Bacilli bacterium]